VTRTKSLEVKFVLKKVVQRIGVLRAVAVVDLAPMSEATFDRNVRRMYLIIRAHD